MPSRYPIALLTTYYRPVVGGVETHAENLARYLARRGHAVTVITKRCALSDPPSEVIDGIEVRRTPPVGERRASGKWLALPGFLRELRRRRSSLRLICCVDYRGIGLAALVAGWLWGVPVVFETSTDGTISGASVRRRLSRVGFAQDGAVARLATWPIRAAYRRADLFICVSRTLERELLACDVPAGRVLYLPHPVDCATFRPASEEERSARRRDRGLPAEATIAIFVGRLSREKGVAELLGAWAGLDVPGARLVIVGPDMPGHPWDQGAAARAFVAAHDLGDRVTFTGGLPQGEVAAWLQAADLGVQPSHFEAFGLAAAEAMAVGLPVIASDVGGFRDYIEPGVNGLRVPPRDVSALRKGLQHLLTADTDRRQMGQAALATARCFDEAIVFARFAEALDRLAQPA
jgi:glycosyltransferase involved in cell wall biosynthesis